MKKKILTIVQIILLAVIFYCTYRIYTWKKDNDYTEEIVEQISDAVVIKEPVKTAENVEVKEQDKYQVNFESLKNTNPDTVAWFKVEGTTVEYPVVQTYDNDFYLTHTFDKSFNNAGWAFMDYRNNINDQDDNTIIYGHNRRDGSMFASLKDVIKPGWYEDADNYKIPFITANKKQMYQVFSVYQIEAEDYYIRANVNESEREEFYNKLKSRSVKDFGVNLTKDDKILTLSTCANDSKYRVVLHAKLMK